MFRKTAEGGLLTSGRPNRQNSFLMESTRLPFPFRGTAFCLIVVAVTLACTTYHAAGPTGGFSETKLSATSYQVYFRGNGYTSPARVQKFMLRRAAELALENGFRYFVIDAPQNLDRRDFWRQYSERGVNVRFAEQPSPDTADAVVVIAETDALAAGRLSDAARATLTRLQGAT